MIWAMMSDHGDICIELRPLKVQRIDKHVSSTAVSINLGERLEGITVTNSYVIGCTDDAIFGNQANFQSREPLD